MTASARNRGRRYAVLWLLFFALCLAVVIGRFNTTVDLSYFLPAAGNAEQQILIDRLGQGAGSQLWFIVMPAGFAEKPAVASERYATALLASGLFRSVTNGQESFSPDSIPMVIFANRYLLADEDFSAEGFAAAVDAMLPDFLLAPDRATEQFLSADPYLSTLTILERIAATLSPDSLHWIAADGTSYLVAETVAPAYDIGEQTKVLSQTQSLAMQQFGVVPETYGVGAYGAQLQQTIQAEARFRTVLASVAIMLVLLLVYRRPALVFMSAVPLVLGAGAALAATTLMFDAVHGITLAFGFTLLGVAIDFPLHIFSHSRHGKAALSSILPTLLLGAASTVLAYFAVAASGSTGLAQLGVFSGVGVLVTLLASVTLLPWMLNSSATAAPMKHHVPDHVLRNSVWLTVVVLAVLVVGFATMSASRSLWSDDLAALTPLPVDTLNRDRELRKNFGAPDIRYLILLQSKDKQQVLQRTAQLAADLRAGKLVSGVQAVSDLLPSRQQQQQRLRALQAFSPDTAVSTARQYGFVDDAFSAFVENVKHLSADREWLSEASYRDTAFAGTLASGLYRQNGVWCSLLMPGQINDVASLDEYLSGFHDAELIDLKQASLTLVQDYRVRILLMLAIAAALVTLLLLVFLGLGPRLYWVLGGLAATLLGTLALNVLLFDALTLFNLIALVLVAGLGLDYLLFMSSATEQGAVPDYRDSRHAIGASMLSTAAAFAVLAASGVPILAGLGVTVFSGVLLAYAIARLGVAKIT